MADGFDVVDAIYEAIKDCGVKVFKDKAKESVVKNKLEHVVIGRLSFVHLQLRGRVPVNVNIYIPKTSSGLVNRTRLKALKNTISGLVQSASMEGYFDLKGEFDHLVTDQEVFDYLNLRYDVIVTA